MTRRLSATLMVLALAFAAACSGGAGSPTPNAPAIASDPAASAPTPGLSPTAPASSPEPASRTRTVRPVDGSLAFKIAFTFKVPDSWELFDHATPWIDANQSPAGAAVWFHAGGALFSNPCRPVDDEAAPDIPVGTSVDDFVTALVDHPSLDVTAPTDVTLAGFSGKYVDLTVPDDISKCAAYRPLDEHIFAQGPGQRWHMWVLNVDGMRVVVETNDYAGTPAGRLAELQSIVDSLVITR
jgi:hypothetical protein